MIPESFLTLVNPVDGNLAFRIVSFEDDGYFNELQRQNYFSIIWIFKGDGYLKVDFSDYNFEEGTMLFFSPYQPFLINCKEGIKGVMLNFHPDFFCIIRHQKEVACNGILFNNIYQPPFIMVDEGDSNSFHSLVDQIKKEVQIKELAQYELLVSYLKIFLINATRLKVQQTTSENENFTDAREPFILQNLKDAIEAHFRKKHSASDYAEILNITPKALGKITKTHFNKTLTDLISERIVIEAKRDLYLTTKSVKEIAYELGFKDEYYFSRYFKGSAKVSPQIYRDSLRTARSEIIN